MQQRCADAGDRRIQRSAHGKLRFPRRVNGDLDRPSPTCGITMAANAKAAGDTTVGRAGDGHLWKRSGSSGERELARGGARRKAERRGKSTLRWKVLRAGTSGALHGATWNRSRAAAQVAVDGESRATPAGDSEPTTFAARGAEKARLGGSGGVNPHRLFVSLSGNWESPRRIECTAGTSRTDTYVSAHGAKTNK